PQRFREAKSLRPCVSKKNILPLQAAKTFLHNPIIICGCAKSPLAAHRAKFYFERHMASTISRSEIVEAMCL
ncbi:MAG: hypothetical protein ACOYOO_15225, partial [Saprospiraceae bacterium]